MFSCGYELYCIYIIRLYPAKLYGKKCTEVCCWVYPACTKKESRLFRPSTQSKRLIAAMSTRPHRSRRDRRRVPGLGKDPRSRWP